MSNSADNVPDRARSALTPDQVAAQFSQGDEGLDGLVRLRGSEIQESIVSRTVENRGRLPLTHRTEFRGDGIAVIHLDNVVHREPYVIVGDALCINSEDVWQCRRFYRDSEARLFVVFASERNEPIPVTVR